MKEARIINTLSPMMGRGALIVDEAVIEEDGQRCAGYASHVRQTYSLFYQMSKMTQVSGALIHDDRIDALEGLCRHFQDSLMKDQDKGLKVAQERAWKEMVSDPCGYNRYKKAGDSRFASMLPRNRRR
jgi:hypothetical protein